MAVDANVITFEQIKEQIRSGKTIRAAIDTGYKNAMSAIIDSNVTTIIAQLCCGGWVPAPRVGFAKTCYRCCTVHDRDAVCQPDHDEALVGVKAVEPRPVWREKARRRRSKNV